MLRAFAMFLLLFWLLSLLVHLHGLIVDFFAVSAFALFALDFLFPVLRSAPRARMRDEPLL